MIWICPSLACTVGQAVHTLPESQPVAGVTSLAGEIYVLRQRERDQLEVYDVVTHRLNRHLTVPNAGLVIDMASCDNYRCMYISDTNGECVHRIDVQARLFTRWLVQDQPWGLSVTGAHNILVTCRSVRKIKEFSSHGDLLRALTLPGDVVNPWHAVLGRDDDFLLCHGRRGDAVHRMCVK